LDKLLYNPNGLQSGQDRRFYGPLIGWIYPLKDSERRAKEDRKEESRDLQGREMSNLLKRGISRLIFSESKNLFHDL
jgi:hypothetical protein